MPLIGVSSSSFYASLRPIQLDPVVLECPLNLLPGVPSVYEVTGSSSGSEVWGSNPYTNNSDWNRAAVHAGIVSVGETANIRFYSPLDYNVYTGSNLNGINTLDYGSFCGVYIRREGDDLSGVADATNLKSYFKPAPLSGYRFTTSASGSTYIKAPIFAMRDLSGLSVEVTKNLNPSVFTGGVDDGFYTLDLPFTINFLGTNYNKIYIGTNSYATFGDGSRQYSSLNYATPNFPKILVSARDNSLQRIYYGTQQDLQTLGRVFRIRFEGTADLHYYGPLGFDEPGDSNMVWELTFYEFPNNEFDLHIEKNARFV
jgi:hypothetical protein